MIYILHVFNMQTEAIKENKATLTFYINS